MTCSFKLLRFDVAPGFGVVYLELMGEGLYRNDPAFVTKYDDAYRLLADSALSEDRAIEFIRQVQKDHYIRVRICRRRHRFRCRRRRWRLRLVQ